MRSTPRVVFGGEIRGSAQRYFRAELPAAAVALHGWRAEVCNYVLFPDAPDVGPRIRGWDGPGCRVSPAPDVVTLRLMDDVDPLEPEHQPDPGADPDSIARARADGQVVLVDLDDDIWNVPGWSPAHRARHRFRPDLPAWDLEVLEANIGAASGVLCTTERIARVVNERVAGARTFIVRNGIDPARFRRHKPAGASVRVGWMGGLSHHLPHLGTILPALDVLDDYGATFVHFGRIVGDDSIARHLYELVPCAHIEGSAWRAWPRVPAELARIDVGLIPRKPGEFNEGQSSSSGLQYAAAGVPFLVSRSREYELLEELGAGIICDTLDDWRANLRRLCRDAELRAELAARGLEVARAHGPRATGARYAEVFGTLLEEAEGVG